jgi:GH15 family glucan-1,4-alpha-glucosidase
LPDRSPGASGDRDDAGYADLRLYAAIGDGRTVALVARDGQVDWLPIPDLSTPPAFAALLDAEHGGYISLRPDEKFTVEREYVANTNVLTTTFQTASGAVRVTDSLNTGVAGRLPWAELARRIEGLTGNVVMTAQVVPGTCLNTASPWVEDTVSGAVLRVEGLTMAVRTLRSHAVVEHDRRVTVSYLTSPGSRHLLAVVATEREPLLLPDPQDIDDGIDRTVVNWTAWSDSIGGVDPGSQRCVEAP